MRLQAKEIELEDIPFITNYWINSSDEHLLGMGADTKLLPSSEQFTNALTNQFNCFSKNSN